ncbi:MAG: YceI family protein [Corynebacterium sp.]|uniref:YceI family protein n=1 Tax=Corynebacterium sp. TaxID=1720 RepID=UPI0026DCCED5|nr:YceI family protein [Corynebacterium sp.]MDO5029885.1 YceI family protein [Corynebacterium sp.]
MALQSGNYVLDTQHSTIGFTVRHAMITKVHGQFDEFESTIAFDADKPENSTAKAAIQANSINTNNEERDNHLRSKDFFGAGENPTIEFTSTAIELVGEEKATVTGDLTINGTTKSVTLDVDIFGSAEDPWGQTRVGFEAATKIDRNDFGIDYNAPIKTGGVLIGNEISLQIDGSAVKQ